MVISMGSCSASLRIGFGVSENENEQGSPSRMGLAAWAVGANAGRCCFALGVLFSFSKDGRVACELVFAFVAQASGGVFSRR